MRVGQRTPNAVIARRKISEFIQATGVGNRCYRIARAIENRVTTSVQQFNRNAWFARITRIANPIIVEIFKDQISDRTQQRSNHWFVDQSRVNDNVVFFRNQSHNLRKTGRWIGVTVNRIVASSVLNCNVHPRWRHKPDLEVTRLKLVKEVVPISIGRCRSRIARTVENWIAATIEKIHDDAGNTGFSCIVNTVGISIEEHRVAQGREMSETNINRQFVFTCRQCHHV